MSRREEVLLTTTPDQTTSRVCRTHGLPATVFAYGWWWCRVFNERCKVEI